VAEKGIEKLFYLTAIAIQMITPDDSRHSSIRPRLAIIGTGIAGLSAAWGLRDFADLTLFESESRPGGHTNTVTVEENGRNIPIDTGFIVFNKITYPHLCRLFDELGVLIKPSEMSLSVQHLASGLEYNGMGLNKLFAQRRNLLSPRFLFLIAEITRFFRVGRQWLRDEAEGDPSQEAVDFDQEDLAAFCKRHRFGNDFLELYLVPMSSAVWSTEPGRILDFPVATLLHFFQNHGFLGISTHHPWFTVDGGARTYVEKILQRLTAPHALRMGDPVVSIEESSGSLNGAWLTTSFGLREHFDGIVLACHANQSLALLRSPSPDQQRLLAPFRYQSNETLLHTDASVMPKRRRAWASWNFRVEEGSINPDAISHRRATTHYWMNALQGVSDRRDYFVSLNSNEQIASESILYSTTYEHPVFTLETIVAQRELPRLNRAGRLFFCGSYFGYGFHEDACKSGYEAATGVKRFFLRELLI
jgi:predicted NAD/FAD-binding protein